MKSILSRKLILPARLDCLDAALDFVKETLGQGGCPGQALMSIEVAAEEIFVNIARYAYPGGEGQVSIRCDVLPGAARIRFADRGTPYNPLERPPPDITLPAGQRPIGGLGIWIVRQTMDSVQYRYEGGENILTMQKTWPAALCGGAGGEGEIP